MRTPESPANALRRKIQRKIELVSKWERKENECVGTDPDTEIKRNWFRGMKQRFVKEKDKLESQLRKLPRI
jgi:hypothetical protein